MKVNIEIKNLPANLFYMSEAPSVGDTLLRVPALLSE